jgi:hypothetical protein
MSWSGFASVSLGDFTLEVDGAVPSSRLLLLRLGPDDGPVGDGFRCAGGTIGRLRPATNSDATGHNSRLVDFGVRPPEAPGRRAIHAGSTWNFSYWYRDPNGPTRINLANGLAVPFGP